MIKLFIISLILLFCSGCFQVSKDPSNSDQNTKESSPSFEVLMFKISNSEIRTNCVIRAKGRIWLGTDDGILSFDAQSLELEKHYLKGKKIAKIAVSSGNYIYARVLKRGLFCMHPDEDNFFFTNSTRIRDFVIKRNTNEVYCATSHGIDIYANSTFENIKIKGQGEFASNAKNVLKIAQDREGSFWLGTNFGLYKMTSRSSFEFYFANYQIIQSGSVINKSGNSPLIGNYFEDIEYMEGTNSLLLATNSGFSLLKDPQNAKNRSSWKSYTGNHGRSIVSDGEVVDTQVKGNAPLPNNYILNALQTKHSLYIGSEDGLAIFKNKKWSILNIDSDFLDDKINDLFLFKKLDKNIVYIATNSGIATITEEKFAK